MILTHMLIANMINKARQLSNKVGQNAPLLLVCIFLVTVYALENLDNSAIVGFLLVINISFATFLFIQWSYNAYKLNKKGEFSILTYERKLTPGYSMLSALNKFDIKIKDIHLLDLECYYIDNDYISGFVNFVHKNNPDIKIKMKGYKDSPDKPLDKNNVEYIVTRSLLREHLNRIETKNKGKFVWYEPFHFIVNNEHFIPEGAFLAQDLG